MSICPTNGDHMVKECLPDFSTVELLYLIVSGGKMHHTYCNCINIQT